MDSDLLWELVQQRQLEWQQDAARSRIARQARAQTLRQDTLRPRVWRQLWSGWRQRLKGYHLLIHPKGPAAKRMPHEVF
jgi:hypothetical protein